MKKQLLKVFLNVGMVASVAIPTVVYGGPTNPSSNPSYCRIENYKELPPQVSSGYNSWIAWSSGRAHTIWPGIRFKTSAEFPYDYDRNKLYAKYASGNHDVTTSTAVGPGEVEAYYDKISVASN